MAYLSKEDTKTMREAIKKEFPKYKFSITNVHCTGISVNLMSADFEIDETYQQVNHYYLEDYSKEVQKVFSRVVEIITNVRSYYNRNANDVGADYADMTFFIEASIGKWNKPYICKKS